jgi:peroxiredoxin Q/BCP
MATLKAGDPAPDINAPDQDGNMVRLSDYRGSKVILYFYPKDDTPGCTAEACNLRDHYTLLRKMGFHILGVSADDASSHKKFIEKYVLPFPLIPDKGKEILKAYGAWGLKKNYGKEYEGILRTTFIISEHGVIEHVITKVQTKDHTRQILEALKQS